jgi:GT2 family glycosyltransferase/glycosyltransferase involved in cell wall biosynthesis/SAM-dependent methyltransferase
MNNMSSDNLDGPPRDEAKRKETIAREQLKWTTYYESLAMDAQPEVVQFGEEFLAYCERLLPNGGAILEAGCGAGWQSLALARSGRYRVDLLDFSEAALDAAKRVFDAAGVQARFLAGDAFETGEPEYDLVFNAGVIEHYTFDEQRKLLMGMASRSRRYVVALAPNRDCYWYWVSRVRNAAAGNWPFGKESPSIDFRGVFESAGLSFCGSTYLARNWTQAFLRNLPGIDEDLRRILTLSHSSPLIGAAQSCYIVGGTGTVEHAPSAAIPEARSITIQEELTGAVADSLALRIGAENALALANSRADGAQRSLSEAASALSVERARADQAERSLNNHRAEAASALEVERARADQAERTLNNYHIEAASALEVERARADQAERTLNNYQIEVASALEVELARADQAERFRLRADHAETLLQQARIEARDSAAARTAVEASLEEATKELAQAKIHAQEVYAAAGHFSDAFRRSLNEYRQQRAWKVMVAIRRAYTLLFREGWRGKARMLFGPHPPLSRYEPFFPVPEGYLPAPKIAQISAAAPVAADPAQAQGLPPARKYDVVVLAIIDFDFRFQRPQQIAAEFARRGHRVFWVTATRVLPMQSGDAYRVKQLRPNVWEVSVRAPQTDLYCGVLSDGAAAQFRDSLALFYREYAIAGSAVMVQLPFWRRLALQLREEPASVLVYDCMDDWDTFENLGDFNRDEEVPLAGECDVLVVTAEKLRVKFEGRSLHPLLVRNGADFEFFRAAEPLPELSAIPKPVVGYFGAIADWIDLDLVHEVAKSRPQYSFVLAGQVFNRDMSALELLPNVHLLGSRPYEQMPRLLAAFDVCIIPFKLNKVTHATDPVKLYEYLSQGKPIVATAMDELRAWEQLLYLSPDAAGFSLRLDAAVAEADPELKEQRIDFARRNNWTARVDLMDAAIRAAFPKVSILIVTHNSADFIGPCLRSLLANTSYPNWEAILVDNASVDGTVELARTAVGGDIRVRIEALSGNTGFSAGNNAAAARASGDYLAFLNADTIVTSGWIEGLLRHVETDDSIGLICPVTNFAGNEAKINVDYSVESEMERFAMRLARERRGLSLDVAVVPLYCALIRAKLFWELGGLDEGYGIGMFEDDDLSNAVRARGLRVVVAEDCFVHHFGQGSFAKILPEEYDLIFAANRRRFESKWKTSWVAHQTRPNVRPPFEERRFEPDSFCREGSREIG